YEAAVREDRHLPSGLNRVRSNNISGLRASSHLTHAGTVLCMRPVVMTTASKRVVIVGGGFGGVQCAKTLRRLVPAGECEIVLSTRENHMVFHPLLPEVAGASLNADGVAAPLRQM